MSDELPQQEKEINQDRLHFEVIEKRPGFTQYIFEGVVVEIDRRNAHVEGVPELIFATYDNDVNEASVNKPNYVRKGVDMEYVMRCIKAVARESGDTQFWFDAYGDNEDLLNDEEKNIRKVARARLFGRHVSVEEGPDGLGYLVNFNS